MFGIETDIRGFDKMFGPAPSLNNFTIIITLLLRGLPTQIFSVDRYIGGFGGPITSGKTSVTLK